MKRRILHDADSYLDYVKKVLKPLPIGPDNNLKPLFLMFFDDEANVEEFNDIYDLDKERDDGGSEAEVARKAIKLQLESAKQNIQDLSEKLPKKYELLTEEEVEKIVQEKQEQEKNILPSSIVPKSLVTSIADAHKELGSLQTKRLDGELSAEEQAVIQKRMEDIQGGIEKKLEELSKPATEQKQAIKEAAQELHKQKQEEYEYKFKKARDYIEKQSKVHLSNIRNHLSNEYPDYAEYINSKIDKYEEQGNSTLVAPDYLSQLLMYNSKNVLTTEEMIKKLQDEASENKKQVLVYFKKLESAIGKDKEQKEKERKKKEIEELEKRPTIPVAPPNAPIAAPTAPIVAPTSIPPAKSTTPVVAPDASILPPPAAVAPTTPVKSATAVVPPIFIAPPPAKSTTSVVAPDASILPPPAAVVRPNTPAKSTTALAPPIFIAPPPAKSTMPVVAPDASILPPPAAVVRPNTPAKSTTSVQPEPTTPKPKSVDISSLSVSPINFSKIFENVKSIGSSLASVIPYRVAQEPEPKEIQEIRNFDNLTAQEKNAWVETNFGIKGVFSRKGGQDFKKAHLDEKPLLKWFQKLPESYSKNKDLENAVNVPHTVKQNTQGKGAILKTYFNERMEEIKKILGEKSSQ